MLVSPVSLYCASYGMLVSPVSLYCALYGISVSSVSLYCASHGMLFSSVSLYCAPYGILVSSVSLYCAPYGMIVSSDSLLRTLWDVSPPVSPYLHPMRCLPPRFSLLRTLCDVSLICFSPLPRPTLVITNDIVYAPSKWLVRSSTNCSCTMMSITLRPPTTLHITHYTVQITDIYTYQTITMFYTHFTFYLASPVHSCLSPLTVYCCI